MPWSRMGERRYSSTILNLGTIWRWVVNFMPLPLYSPRKLFQYPLYMRLGGPQSRSGRCGEDKNVFPLAGIDLRFFGFPTPCLAAISIFLQDDNIINSLRLFVYINFLHYFPSPMKSRQWFVRPNCELAAITQILSWLLQRYRPILTLVTVY
jgi:hypothetical protein